MKRIAVTGGSGKAGRAVVRELVDHGYRVVNLDLAPPEEPLCPFTRVDLTDFGETMDALSGIAARARDFDALIHLAAIPSPGQATDERTFRINITSAYNAFSAATRLGLERVVWASSETVLGIPFRPEPPAYAPLDEEAPARPEFSYALSKVLAEEMARQFARAHPEIPFIGIRPSNVMEPREYEFFPSFQRDAALRSWNLWGYVDVRDLARGFRLALEAEISGAEVFIIAAGDTVMERDSRELMAEVYPDTPINGTLKGRQTLLSINKARQMLGYEPQISWRDQI